MSKKEELKRQILQLTREYYNEVHKTSKVFEPGKSFVNYGGRYFNDEEMVNLVDSSLDFWLTAGPWAHKFEIAGNEPESQGRRLQNLIRIRSDGIYDSITASDRDGQRTIG